MQAIETVHVGRDNSIDLVLVADCDVPDLASVTRMDLIIEGGPVIDSTSSPGVFDWTTHKVSAAEAAKTSWAHEGDDKLVLSLGGVMSAPGVYKAKLAVYDDEHQNGIIWGWLALRVE